MFIFSFYRANLDLHSFPTRRSSDLQLGHDSLRVDAAGQDVAVFAVVGKNVVARLEGRHHADDRRLLTQIEVAVAADLDRKSTRLNSSHGYISYAVFCLKKKKTVVST